MSNKSFLQNLLSKKIPDSTEIEIHFFELCNLRCHFCGQDHEAKEGLKTIMEKIPRVKEFISDNYCKSHILNLMGGELFNDDLPDSIYEDYFNFASTIHQYAQSLGHTVHFNWVTNLIFQKNDRVQSLLARLAAANVSCKISTSYDFAGRKTNLWNVDLFKKNLEIFKGRIFTVGFVLTKPAIKALRENEDPFFEYLYANYPLYFDYYVPENGANLLMPSDQEMLDYLLFVAKRYPLVSPVKELLENEQNKMTCYSLNKLTLLPSGKEVKCRYLNYKDGQFKNEIDYSSNENIIESFITENQCLTCNWYEKCGFRCFVQADWKNRDRTATCVFKEFFDTTAGATVSATQDKTV